jgi:hypothetical protein
MTDLNGASVVAIALVRSGAASDAIAIVGVARFARGYGRQGVGPVCQ